MKIGIVTVQYSNNFGAVLQAYGLKSVLERMGHQVFFIRTCTDKFARGMFYRIRPYGKEYQHLLKFIKKNYNGWKQKQSFLPAQREFQIIDQWTDEELDLIILGSDEIWNATNPIFLQPVFYGVGMKPVMTYAVSLGNATVEDMKKIPTDYFDEIDPVLVRDRATRAYLDSIGVKSELVCDPTILAGLDIFQKPYTHHLMEKPYMLVYAYGHLETVEVQRTLRAFAKKQGLRLLSVCFPLDWCDGTILCSPLEFCAVIQGARYVYTSTFHGTIFAAMNRKPFVSLPYSMKTNDLLQTLGMEDRLISFNSCTEQTLEQKYLHDSIDFDAIDAKFKMQRESSMRLLADGIERKRCK